MLFIAISKREQVAQVLDTLYQNITRFGSLVINAFIRDDSAGSGAYGASRNGRVHMGVDLAVQPGSDISAPVDAIITRMGYPYADNTNYKLIELKGAGDLSPMTMKIMYVDPIPSLIGQQVPKGRTIAYAQKISDRYPNQGMTDHVHVEMRWNGAIIDPTPFLTGTQVA